MIKNLSGGSIINYGPSLPAASSAFDGTLFYKTTGDDQGLYIFTFSQDSNTTFVGDQPAMNWVQAQSPGLHVDSTGVKIGSNLTMETGLLTIFSNNYGVSDPSLPMTFLNDGDTIWRKTDLAGGTEMMRLTSAGVLKIGGNTVWNSGNDQQANAGKLNGQAASFYQNASNINAGTLNRARLPYAPVHQGGGDGQDGSKEVYIGSGTVNNAQQLLLSIDSTSFSNVWPISITGNAGTANFANSATAATNANYATNAGTAAAAPWTGITGRPTAVSSFDNDAGYLSSSGGGFISSAVNVWSKSADTLNRVIFNANASTTFGGPAPLPSSVQPVGQQSWISPGTFSFVVPTGVTSISVVTVGAGGAGGGGTTSYGGAGGGGGALRYIKTLAVVAGETLTVEVGAGGVPVAGDVGGSGGTTSIKRLVANGGSGQVIQGILIGAGGGGGGMPGNGVSGGSYGGTLPSGLTANSNIGGGDGGMGGAKSSAGGGGGGGAGGYDATVPQSGVGSGGNGASPTTGTSVGGMAGQAGGAAGGGQGTAATTTGSSISSGGGGGVGVSGPSTAGLGGGNTGNLTAGGQGGSGGLSSTAGVGANAGGGGAGGDKTTSGVSTGGKGGDGAVRIIWGANRAYPSTNVSDQTTQVQTVTNIPAFVWLSNNLTIMSVDTGGNLVAAGDVTAFSDARLKKDVSTITNPLSKVLALNGVTFTRSANGTRGTGLIAQDVQAVLPEAVQVNDDSLLSVAYGNLAGLFVEAIKELKAEIDDLKSELSKK